MMKTHSSKIGLAKMLLLTALAVIPLLAGAAKPQRFTLASPDGRVVTHILFANDATVSYDLFCDGVMVLQPSSIGLTRIYAERTSSSLSLKKASRVRTIRETIASPFTRQDEMEDFCNELSFQLKEGLTLVFRAYNEGVAYRFITEMPCQIQNERVEYRFDADYEAVVPYVSNFKPEEPFERQFSSSFENLYTTQPLSRIDARRLCFLPLLVKVGQGVRLCITETHLEHFSGLYLQGDGNGLKGVHAPYPRRVEQGGHNNLQLLVREREDYIAQLGKGDEMPWRIAMIARSDAALAMNNLSYLLAAPCRMDDLSWIKPGKVAWDWWNNWNIGGVDFEAGINNDTYKHYIDFASRYGIEYVILDEGWAVNGQADLFQVVPEIDIPMLARYAEEHGVGLILWAGYYAFDRDMERVCQHYSAMGIKGFKIDFMDRDDQIVTDFYYRAAAMCAKYRLVADFHGAFKPAGLNRTWPNVLNFEGVAGLEQLKWAPASWNQVQYDTEIPFIRQTAGPMDYTQGAMHNAAYHCYSPCWSEPMSQGTRCHQLALYIVLESPLNMMCDSPTNYERERECAQLIASLPTVWDETRVLQGEVGQYIVTARRKGDTWYIGGITNWTARDLSIDLTQLQGMRGTLTLFADGANAHRKGIDYRRQQSDVPVELKIHMAPGGGFMAIIK